MNRILSSTVFTDVFWQRHDGCHQWDFTSGEAIELRACVPPNHHVVLVGGSDELGNWQAERGVRLECEKLPVWFMPTNVIDWTEGDEFKFAIMHGEQLVAWETGHNRRWGNGHLDMGEFRGAPHYAPRFAGVAMPVFSIKGEGCQGVGDFLSLGDFASWAAAAGLKVVQTLPVNDTTITHTWRDSYPYKSISIFALHPLYIRVSAIDDTIDVSALHELEKLPQVDYDKVDAEKWRLFGEIYAKIGEKTLESEDFKEFFDKNQFWIEPYAAFSLLRDKFATATFSEWPAPYNTYSKELETKLLEENKKEAGLYYFLQFHADRQLRTAHEAAHAAGVVLKGDIPIGVSRDSVEAWSEPRLFNMNGQAGSPPDDFSVEGQNWGFPTYNWAEMARDNYAWWKARFVKMADYFDMYRIDHILGFFRIWEIPLPETSGLMGHFSPALPFSAQELECRWGLPMYEERYIGVDNADHNTLFVRDHSNPKLYHPRIAAHSTDRYRNTLDWYEKERFNALYTHYFYERNNQFWADEAIKKLPHLINATRMLCCAEDLGMIPASVASTLEAMEIVTLEIQRMPKDPNMDFGIPAYYPYSCVATTSSHDINPLRAWWDEDRNKTQHFYNEEMQWWGAAPAEATVEVCENIVRQHVDSPAMAAIIPLQDWLSIAPNLRAADPFSERINVPSDPNHYWRYRSHLSTEQLVAATAFNQRLKDMVIERY